MIKKKLGVVGLLFGISLFPIQAYSYGFFSGTDSEQPALFNSSLNEESYDLDQFPKWTTVMGKAESDRHGAAGECSSGDNSACKLNSWMAKMRNLRDRSTMEKVSAVNRMVNSIPYGFDQRIWGRSDYWASPKEFLGKNKGDCEDYAIAKYYGLLEAGFSPSDMRVVILRDMRLQILHAVLAVNVGGTSYILDNRNNSVTASSSISHYSPIYSINEQAWWRHQA